VKWAKWATKMKNIVLSAFEAGAASKLLGGSKEQNPYIGRHYQYREERMENEVLRRRWDAGFEGKPDPYPGGWA
jgi:hypothetical protein